MKPIFRSSLFALILVLGQAFGGLIIVPIFKMFHLSMSVSLVLGQVITIIVPSIIYFKISKLPVRENLRLNPITIIDIIIIIAIGICIQPIAMFLGALANMFFPNVISQVVNQMSNLSIFTKLGVIALTPAICEEISMRGIYLSGYKKVDIKIGAVMSGLIFGILHMNFQQFFYAFALGVLLAYLVHITNSIFASMICHFTFNAVSVLISALAVKLTKIQGSVPQDISSVPMLSKVLGLLMLLIFAIIFTSFVGLLLWALVSVNKNRKLRRQDMITNEQVTEGKEKILNWPFLSSIAVFIIAMLIYR